MGAARKLDHRANPRASKKRTRSKTRTLRKTTSRLRMVKGKPTAIEVRWTEGCMKDLQRKCYHLRMAHNWTQAELAAKAGLCTSTVIRFEDESCPMLAPRLKTFLEIFRKGFGMEITVTGSTPVAE